MTAQARWGAAYLVWHGDRYFVSNDEGYLIVARFTPEGYVELDRTMLLEGMSQLGHGPQLPRRAAQRQRGGAVFAGRRGLPMSIRAGLLAAGLLLAAAPAAVQAQGAAEAIFQRAVADFEQGRIAVAAAGFDQVAELLPQQAPHLWQRGIALYYAERYGDCREQFESHRTVNPNDVENAVWHYLCVARAESPAAAEAALLPVGPDSRVPMREIYQMFSGDLAPAGVMAAAGDNPRGRFYAHLYLGLYYEAQGRADEAFEQIELAAGERYARAGGYMHMVARVHLGVLRDR